MKHAIFAALLLCAAAPALAAPADPLPQGLGVAAPESQVWPPEQFRHDNAAVALFLDRAGIAKFCGRSDDDPKHVAIGCAGKDGQGTPVMVLPNPCLVSKDDPYAAVACHELAHINGWQHADPSPPPAAPRQEQADPAAIASR